MVKKIHAFSILFVFAASTLLNAASGDLDAGFITNLGAGITGSAFPESFPTGAVQALGIQPDGKILLGSGGGMSRFNNTGALTALKRLNADGTLDAGFAPNTAFENGPHTTVEGQGSEINTILVNADGSFYIGGVFANYGPGSTIRVCVAKVHADGTLDTDFVPPNLGTFGGQRYVQSLVTDGQGRLYIGGVFFASGRANLIRVDATTGALDTTFTLGVANNTQSVVDSVSLAADGRIYISGATTGSKPFAHRLLSTGELDNSFLAPFTNDFGRVNKILALPDGRVLLGGGYSILGRPESDFLVCVTADGALDAAFMANQGTGTNGWVGGILQLLPDGRILAGGIFNEFNGTPIASLMILNSNGTRDATFTPAPYDTNRHTYVTHFYGAGVQPDGKLVAGGWFERVTDPDLDIRNLVRFDGGFATGPGAFQFVSATYSTLESTGSVKVQVARLPGVSGAVSVNYATGGGAGTALAGTDYTSTDGTLNWADGEGGLKTITIPVLNNAAAAAAKTFRVALSSATGGAGIGSVGETLVTILDDDGAPIIVTPPADVTLNQGANLSLSVVITSALPVNYQWQYDSGGGFQNLVGRTERTLVINQVTPEAHAGQYRVLVGNANTPVDPTASAAATVVVKVPAGSVIPAFNASVPNPIVKAVRDAQGRYLIATSGTHTVIRRNADGSVDGDFNAPTFSSALTDVLPLPDGKVLVSGFFSTVGGVARKGVARLNATGSLDESFNLGIAYDVECLGAGAGDKFYVGGYTGNSLKRYNANATLDAAFAPATIGTGGTNGIVWAVRESGDGTLFVAHQVHSGLPSIYRFAKLNVLDGSAVPGFSVGALNWNIYAWDLLPDGRIVIAGRFSLLEGGTHNRIAILNANGSLFDGFNVGTGPSGPVRGVKYHQGRIFAWGEFLQVNGIAQRGIARFNLDGSNDPSFVVGTGASNHINSLLLTADNEIHIFGAFTSFNGVSKNYVAALVLGPGSIGFEPARYTVIEDAVTVSLTLRRYGNSSEAASISYETVEVTAEAGTDFTPAAGTVNWAAGDSADKTVNVTIVDNALVQSTRSFQVALTDPQGDVMPAAPATVTLLDDDTPVTFTTQPAGTSILAGQNFTLTAATTSPTPTTYQWLLNGNPVSGANAVSYARTGAAQIEGGVYTLIATNSAGSVSSDPALVVISPAPGTPAADYAPQDQRPNLIVSSNTPRALAPHPDGGVYAGGWFSQVNGSNTFRYLVKVFADGTLDTDFNPLPNGSVYSLLRQPDGKLLVGGDFTQMNGISAVRLARLNVNGSLDTDFQTNLGSLITAGQVNRIALLSDGRIVVGGSNSGNYLNLIAANGTPDFTFRTNASPNGAVLSLAVQDNDQILVGGSFTNIGGSAISRFARLETTGLRDATLSNGVGGSGLFNDLLIDHLDRIFAAGSNFSNSSVLAHASSTGAFASNMGTSGAVADIHEDLTGKLLILRSSGTLSRFKGSNPLPSPGSADGDATFTAVTLGGTAYAVTVTPDGAVWAAGAFDKGLVKLNGDLPDPAIVNQPGTQGVNPGATAFFSVGAVGSGLAYQWFKDGVELNDGGRISGATTAILTISDVETSDDDDYTVEVTGGTPEDTVLSEVAHLHVLGAPEIVNAAPDQTPALGTTIMLAPEVRAATPATFVWTRNGVLIQNGGRYSGANTATLVIEGGNSADNGTYVLTITNSFGTDNTSSTVTVNQIAQARDTSLSALSVQTAGSTNNYVNAFLHLPDGRTLLAGPGSFKGVDNVQVSSHLAIITTAGNFVTLPAGAFNGEVRALHLLANGKVLAAGNFTQIGGVPRNRIARLNADLTLDTSFNPAGSGASNIINRLTVDTAGRIYISGSFFGYDGVNGYSNYVRLLPDGTLDLEYKVSFTGGVSAMAPLPDGKILIGGVFSHSHNDVVTNNLNNLCRLLPSGAIDPTFTSGLPSNYGFNTFALDAMGRIVVGANSFVSPNAFYHLLRLLPNGGLDSSFNLPDTINGEIWVVKVLGNGQILVGGRFTTPTNRLFMVNTDGTRDTTFNVGTGFTHTSGSPIVTTLSQDTLGRIWVGGTVFTSYNGTTANAIAVLQGQGTELAFLAQPAGQTLDLGTTATFTTAVTANNGFTFQWRKGNVALVNGGRISGATSATLSISDLTLTDAAAYSVVVTTPGASITSAEATLTILSAPEILDNPVSLTRDMGGTAIFSGRAKGAATLLYQWFLFDTALVDGTGIAGATTPTLTLTGVDFADAGNYRLRVSNHLGTEFTTIANLRVEKRPGALAAGLPGTTTASGSVLAILRLADGSMLVGGQFSTITVNGVANSRSRLARFLADGTLDPAFTPTVPSTVRAIAQDAAGRVFIAGDFNGSVTIGGVTANRIRVARLTSALVLDTAFDTSSAGPNANINALAPTENGGVYVGGAFGFNTVGTTTVNRVARLNASGALDTDFAVPTNVVNNEVKALLRRSSDGKLYIGGTFGTVLVTTAGGRDTDFTAAAPSILAVQGQAFLLLPDGSLLLAANGGLPQTYLRRLNANTGDSLADYSAGHVSQVSALARQADGKLLSGSIGPIKRTDPATGLDDTGFAAFNSTISALAVDGSGRIWVGGSFNQYGGVSQGNFAILNGGELDSRDGLLTPQNITFAEINNRTFNPAANSFTIPAVTSNSGLPVSVAVTSGLASINGNTVTITGAGQVTITATQAGDATYASASVSRTFTVAKGDQTINFPALSDRSAASGPFNLNASASSGLPVSYSLVIGPASVTGSEVTLTGDVGTVTLEATQAGDDNWNPAMAVQQSFEATNQPVVPVAQAITWAPPASIFQGQLPLALGATASSGLPVVYAIVSGTGTIVNGHLTAATNGTLKIRATQPGNSSFLAAAFVEKSIAVKANPTALTLVSLSQVYTGTGRAASVLPTTAGTFYYTINKVKGTTLPVNVGSYPVEFVSTVGGVKKTGSLVITKAPLRVIPDSQRRFVGQDNPALTFSYDGFLGSDTSASSVSKAPAVTTTATKTSPGGSYPIKPAGGTSANYAFVYVNATMKVETWAGQYEALVEATGSGLPAGKLEITVLANSIGFTGKLTSSKNAAVAFKGNLTRDLDTEHATATVSGVVGTGVNAVTYGLEFDLPLTGDFEAELTRKVGAGVAAPFGETTIGQKIFLGTGKPPVPYAGAHTMIITKPVHLTGSVLPLPGGSSRATAVIDVKGKMTLAGVLADGTKITASLFPDHQAGFRLYALPYAAGRLDSYAAAWLDLMPHPDLAGRGYIPEQTQAFYWAKSANSKDLNYRGGFPETNGSITLDPWLPPVTKPAIINLRQRLGLNGTGEMDVLDDLPGTLTLTGLPDTVTMDAAGKVIVPVTTPKNPRAWKVTITPATGLFVGSHTVLDGTKSLTVNFSGVMRQPSSTDPSPELIGAGFGIVPQLTGQSAGTTSTSIEFERP